MKIFGKELFKKKNKVVVSDEMLDNFEDNLVGVNSSLNDEKFVFTQSNVAIHDAKFETKPVSYFRDCFRRFCKNKSSIVAAIILLILVLYAIFVPAFSPMSNVPASVNQNGMQDDYFANCLPKLEMFEGTGFWDGSREQIISESVHDMYLKIDESEDSNYDLIVIDDEDPEERVILGQKILQYTVKIDTYTVGNVNTITLSPERYQNLIKWSIEHGYGDAKGLGKDGKPVESPTFKPLIDVDGYLQEYSNWLLEQGVSEGNIPSMLDSLRQYYLNSRGNYFFKVVHARRGAGFAPNSFVPLYDDNDELIDIYMRDENNELVYATYSGGVYSVRFDYRQYFEFNYGFKPVFIFGTTSGGRDIFSRLAEGARFSLFLGLCIAACNFIIGIIWGSIAGYYGGRVDLTMERITDIIAAIPSLVILNIVNVYFANNNIVGLILALILPGWIGTASLTRMQFYRFKGQEYVLASRTLGAKDTRLIFKHIFPNAIGTLVTSSVLMIPSVIFSESSLTYLGIINLGDTATVGVMLQEGQQSMMTFPHALIIPAVFVALLMICFNLFGNGLRDAFNTTLRGAED